MSKFRPLLAAGKPKDMSQDEFLDSISKLPKPWGCTPKIDGIRAICLPPMANEVVGDLSVPVCRSLKLVPNRYVRELMRTKCVAGLDGELTCGTTFQAVTSGIMSHTGQPTFTYYVFDYLCTVVGATTFYKERVKYLKALTLPDFCRVLEPTWVDSMDALLKLEEDFVSKGAEGLMLRPDISKYKFGRSTLREGHLIKLKRFEDSEGRVIGWKARDHNMNEAERNELGYQERSSSREGMVKVEELGAFEVEDIHTGVKFWVGSGFTAGERIDFWRDREKLKGEILKYKFQPFGVKDKPRTPIYLGWRCVIDMDMPHKDVGNGQRDLL